MPYSQPSGRRISHPPISTRSSAHNNEDLSNVYINNFVSVCHGYGADFLRLSQENYTIYIGKLFFVVI